MMKSKGVNSLFDLTSRTALINGSTRGIDFTLSRVVAWLWLYDLVALRSSETAINKNRIKKTGIEFETEAVPLL